MNEKFRVLRQKILNANSTDEKIQHLGGAGDCELMILTGCGPALKHIDQEKLIKQANMDKAIIVAVKESLSWWTAAGARPDFHLTSSYVSKHVSYPEDCLPICIYLLQGSQIPQKNAIVDIPLHIVRGPMGLKYQNRCISHTKEFDKWKFSVRTLREFGPTIVPTVAFYLAEHLKISTLLTLGVDFTGLLHYYQDEDDTRLLNPPTKAGSLTEQNWFIRASEDWWNWLHENGIDWYRMETDVKTNLPMIPQMKYV